MSKSNIAKIEEAILKFTKPDYMVMQKKVDEFLEKKSETTEKPVKSIFKSIDFNGMQVFTFGDKKSKNTILFMHGGAYVDVNESIEKITELYKSLIDLNTNLILMGDSAGGGFILSFSQYIKTINLTQPDHIITFSPWVDISMSNSPYNDENDPILGEIGLREIGKSWAGNLDTKDYKVSPLFGNVANQAPTLIFAGDNEIFYKDIKLYVEKLEENDVNVKFITGKGLFHIYPLFPIPEAKKAFKEIKKEIMA